MPRFSDWMSGLRKAEDTAVPLADLMHIEAICDRFEAAWRADGRPDLAAFMADGPGPDPARDRLLHGLLTLDLEFRIGRGESPDPQAYLEQFPEYSAAIREVFADFGHGQAQAPLPEHRNRIQGPGTLAASPGADTQFGEALPRAELSSAALEALRSAGYEIYGELGRGGMGVVYLARKLALNRPCALKMILAGPHAGSAAAARFRTEAEAVARLRHPGIVQIYHVGEAGGLPFLELEYLPGGNLDRALDGTPRAPEKAAQIVEVLARAIAEAHGKGIVHRDLKPANVLLEADGSPKIADFGLAKLLDSDSDLTRTADGARLAQLHGARAGRGPLAPGRSGDRRLRPGGHPLHPADRRPAVPGSHGAGDAGSGQVHRSGPAVTPAAGAAARPGDNLPEVPGEGTVAAVRSGPNTWPRIFAATRRASRSWHAAQGHGNGAGNGPGGGRLSPLHSPSARRPSACF